MQIIGFRFEGQMKTLKLDAVTTALILIDLRQEMVATQTDPYTAAAVLDKGAALAVAFRAKGAMIVNMRVDPKNYRERTAGESSTIPDDLMNVKRHWGVFPGTSLEQSLRGAGVQTVVIGGVATSAGVETTARNAAGLGFGVVIAEDACTDREGAAYVASFQRIFPRLGEVRKTAEVIGALA
jgi:nicotinamidase-related amidase